MASWIKRLTFLGVDMVHIDFSGTQDPDEGFRKIAEAQAFVASGPRGKQLVITEFTNTIYNVALVNAIKKFAMANKPYIKAEAVVGLSATQKLVLNAIVKVTGRNYYAAKDLYDAKRWLATQK